MDKEASIPIVGIAIALVVVLLVLTVGWWILTPHQSSSGGCTNYTYGGVTVSKGQNLGQGTYALCWPANKNGTPSIGASVAIFPWQFQGSNGQGCIVALWDVSFAALYHDVQLQDTAISYNGQTYYCPQDTNSVSTIGNAFNLWSS